MYCVYIFTMLWIYRRSIVNIIYILIIKYLYVALWIYEYRIHGKECRELFSTCFSTWSFGKLNRLLSDDYIDSCRDVEKIMKIIFYVGRKKSKIRWARKKKSKTCFFFYSLSLSLQKHPKANEYGSNLQTLSHRDTELWGFAQQ